MKDLKIVPYLIEKNTNGTFAIIENPKSKIYGSCGWVGEKVVRSPFNSVEEARQREKEIAKYYQFKIKEIK